MKVRFSRDQLEIDRLSIGIEAIILSESIYSKNPVYSFYTAFIS